MKTTSEFGRDPNMNLSGDIREQYQKSEEEASQNINSFAFVISLLEKVDKIIEDVNLGTVSEVVTLFKNLVKDSISGEYTGCDKVDLVKVVASLVYLVTPTDFIPDIIPGIGVLDDIMVLTFVFDSLTGQLQKYQAYKDLTVN